jgi:RecA-family ATPase
MPARAAYGARSKVCKNSGAEVCVCHHSSKLVSASRVARSHEKGFVARRSRSVVARAGVAEMPKEVREQVSIRTVAVWTHLLF